ncbi:MAG: hypothetical protein FWD62_15695 [Betaproteobacteria bacterium]|nr:hypothetical protein [Betaproteobacteria bacterium]
MQALAFLITAVSVSAHAGYDRRELRPVYQEKSLYRNILVLEGGGYPHFAASDLARRMGAPGELFEPRLAA